MNDEILMELLERFQNRFYGKYRGTVTAVDTEQPRIKAKVPSVLGDQETDWCMPCVPYAGNKAGMAFLPEEGAGVWIEFEGGDVSFPIWVGCYWHENEVPDQVAPKVRVIKTEGNQLIVMDDENHKVIVSDCNDNSVTMNSDGVSTVRGSGKLEVTDGKVSANDGAMEVT